MTAGPMTEHDRALWVAAQDDYTKALLIAAEAWKGIKEATPEAIQAATATILIHITKLRSEERLHVKVGPVAVKRDDTQSAPSQAPAAAIPSACPQCGGKVWDNRDNKKNPKAPDWKCRDKECKDDKGFTTGGWVDKPKGKGANSKPVPAGSFDDLPPALDEEDSGLPF
jgi:hypothetical protein